MTMRDAHVIKYASVGDGGLNGSNSRKLESSMNPPRRVPNAERRRHEFLASAEVESLIKAAEKLGLKSDGLW